MKYKFYQSPILFTVWLLLTGSVHTDILQGNTFLSVRALGLTRHLINISYNAPYYPLKIDRNAVYIFNPGFLISFDKLLIKDSHIFWRSVQAFYIDCAIQPAMYTGTMIFKQPMFQFKKLSIGAGFGFGIDIRRSWKKYADPEIDSRLFKDWGNIEGIIGPFCEVEFLYWIDEKKQWVLNIVPGLPVIAFISAGLRFRL